MSRLTGKTAIVTGGGRGIGRSIALALAKEGADVVVSARTQTEIDAVSSEIEGLGQESLAIAADVTNINDVERLFQQTDDQFNRVDILINNAGGIPSELYDADGSLNNNFLQPLWEQSEKVWDQIIATNLKSVFLWMKVAIPSMIAQGHGDIINIASLMGRKPGPFGAGGYSEAKHAVIALTQNASFQTAEHGIRVNAISPGLIDSPGQRRFMAAHMTQDQIPPMDETESVAASVLYLLCETPKNMTGQSLDLFGVR
ncbi:SDR family oxidoreductase [Chloroflexi bacterium TSY]|nr:SDR family oxidoreductase [Chloroflexi bacterium TSY]